jgi:hypothetical protein
MPRLARLDAPGILSRVPRDYGAGNSNLIMPFFGSLATLPHLDVHPVSSCFAIN